MLRYMPHMSDEFVRDVKLESAIGWVAEYEHQSGRTWKWPVFRFLNTSHMGAMCFQNPACTSAWLQPVLASRSGEVVEGDYIGAPEFIIHDDGTKSTFTRVLYVGEAAYTTVYDSHMRVTDEEVDRG